MTQMKQCFEVFWRFLLLGCVSFGGPAAHIGYFRNTFVMRLKWLNDDDYAQLVALSQFLPGPGSSQVGFAIGLRRNGLAGGAAAFLGFTLPSFLLMVLIATITVPSQYDLVLLGAIQGLKLLAVVVVADACWSMFSLFCRDRTTVLIAITIAATLVLFDTPWLQIMVIVAAAATGILVDLKQRKRQSPTAESTEFSAFDPQYRIHWSAFAIFVCLLFGLPLLSSLGPWLALGADFYQAGSLVFGGGHVVLPLLEQTAGHSVSSDQFLTAYALAQAVPGPMFTIATYLGVNIAPHAPLLGAVIATLAIFLPGFLLIIAFHESWQTLASNTIAASAVWGINAAVVGLLLAALYQPVFLNAVTDITQLALVIGGFALLRMQRIPILLLVCGYLIIGIVLMQLG